MATIDEHPKLDGVVEEVSTKAYQQYHYDTVDCAGDDCTSDTAFCIGNDSGTAVLEEAAKERGNGGSRLQQICGF